MPRFAKGNFRSLAGYNYRTWASGALVSNVGTWMQRTAQDWIVLAELTHRNATAVGIVMALQFGPQMVLLPLTGFAADHMDRRKLLFATQAMMGLLALGLGLLTVTGVVALWHVYAFALALGCVTAFDSPARQTFVSDLVTEGELPNAVALNSMSFNAGRMIGPAVAGSLIAGIGTGWVFLLNALSFAAVIVSLMRIRTAELHVRERPARSPGSLLEGFGYVWKRPDLRAALTMLFLIGTFGLNFPIFISTMSLTVFHAGAGEFGVLSSVMALGSVAGAFLAAGRDKPHIALLFVGAAVFGVACLAAALMPNYILFGITLVVIGVAAQTFTTTTNATVQLSTEPAMRGRVMAILLAIAMGTTPIGAPIVGWVADTMGPRWSLGIAAVAGIAAAAIGLKYLFAYRGLRVWRQGMRLRYVMNDLRAPPPPVDSPSAREQRQADEVSS
ncbi:MFS transporter [Pinirhizobacter sp.]|jgi:MFS family permease|uniref:MFS transporter n=1 Tax=Pinirhizobacter sp. TaxID=2950432 RepID=UPI002F415400